uniref:Uncharacterized protein n=1 Tax=Oryza sativa subsp. japonica TaxID=39947 RepID=Q6K7M7_ORYSJ|nr:hypothetical protein [Oryza sativa Japonica Group]
MAGGGGGGRDQSDGGGTARASTGGARLRGERGKGRGVLTEGGDGETTTERRPAAERMAAVGTGGDENGVPTTPDHGGATAEGRWDAANAVEAVARRGASGKGGADGQRQGTAKPTAVLAQCGSCSEVRPEAVNMSATLGAR